MNNKFKVMLFGLLILIMIETIVVIYGNSFTFLLFVDTFLATIVYMYHVGDLKNGQ